MTAKDFRRIALGMQGAVEGAHMAHPDFRAHGRIFATIDPSGTQGMVKLTPDQQRDYIAANPKMFVPAAGAWGRSGCTMVQFVAADHDTVGEAMTLAWQGTIKAKKPARKT
jgi:YjbR